MSPELTEFIGLAVEQIGTLTSSERGLITLTMVQGLLLCVGAVTTMRWCDARLRDRKFRVQRRASMQRWADMPAPAIPYAPPVTPSWTPFRSGPGPRDW